MFAIVCCSASGSSRGKELRGLGLREDHREGVADHVVHVPGQPACSPAVPGDLLGPGPPRGPP